MSGTDPTDATGTTGSTGSTGKARLEGHRVPGYEAGGFLVMADPEGNEFCIIPAGSFDVDADGRADYLDRE